MTNRFRVLPFLLVPFSVVVLLPAAWAQLSGEWEGIVEFPRRPLVLNVEFSTLQARIDVLGSRAFPIQELSQEGGRVRFSIPLGRQVLQVEGTVTGEEISGQFTEGEESAPLRLRRLPHLAKPAGRVQAWEQDLDVLLNRFLAYDRSFSPAARQRFRETMAELRRELPRKNDQQITVALARAVTLSGNAHTRLYLVRNMTEVRRYPLRLWWFPEGAYVVRAAPEYARAIGCRVVSIAGHDPAKLRRAVGELFAGNNSWVDYKSVLYMTSPEILYGLGFLRDMEQTEFTFGHCKTGRFTHTIKPLPLVKKTTPTEAWWSLPPQAPQEDASLVSWDAPAVPLYLSQPGRHYFYQHLGEHGALYFQYNRAQNDPNGPLLREFGEDLLRAIEEQSPRLLIVDLRFNTGGNLDVGRTLMEQLHQRMAGRPVYVLIGRATFSAGITHAAQWKQMGAILAGEPVGDELDTWSEGGNLVLPNSMLTVHYTNAFHKYSDREYPELRPYFHEMQVPDLKPDLPVRVTARQFFSARDPVLDAALADARRRSRKLPVR